MSDFRFSSDWFMMHIPMWEQVVLPALPEGRLGCLEIGTHEGRSAVWIIENIIEPRLHSWLQCVDPLSDGVYAIWEHNMRALPRHSIVSISRTPFEMWFGQRTTLSGIDADTQPFHFVYVDGDHYAASVMVDACLAFKLLCSGGVMVLDDYLWRDRSWPDQKQPGRGIDAFLSAHVEEYDLLHRGYQVVIKKR